MDKLLQSLIHALKIKPPLHTQHLFRTCHFLITEPCSDDECNCFDNPCDSYGYDGYGSEECLKGDECQYKCGYDAYCCCREPSETTFYDILTLLLDISENKSKLDQGHELTTSKCNIATFEK